MSAKREIIRILETNRGSLVSGEQLAQELGVTRAAVWKAVKALQEEGYAIESVSHKGYRLRQEDDMLSEEGIRYWLKGALPDCRIRVLKQVDSTNLYGRKLLLEEDWGRMLIVANEQTRGRGRFGKSFFSPADTGIYMSLVWRERRALSELLPITVAAAVAVCRVLEQRTGEQPRIKWVNDIWLDGKKVCGILTEAVSDMESGMLEALIVGIGLNVRTRKEDFPEELQKTAGSLLDGEVSRNRLIAEITKEMFDLSRFPGGEEVLEEYRSRSLVLGRQITWKEGEMIREGKAVAINREGNLEVMTRQGRVLLKAGEVSLCPEKLKD